MATPVNNVEKLATREYKYGFDTEIEAGNHSQGLNEEIIRLISAKKDEPEWLLEWRLKAYRHWLTMEEPTWAKVKYPPIDYQNADYYRPRKPRKPKSLDEVDPELLELTRNWASP